MDDHEPAPEIPASATEGYRMSEQMDQPPHDFPLDRAADRALCASLRWGGSWWAWTGDRWVASAGCYPLQSIAAVLADLPPVRIDVRR